MPIERQHNQVWDAQGNLISEEWIDVEVPDPVDPAMAAFVGTLSPEQQEALKKALGL